MQTTKKEEKLSLSCSRVNVNATRFVVHPCFLLLLFYMYIYILASVPHMKIKETTVELKSLSAPRLQSCREEKKRKKRKMMKFMAGRVELLSLLKKKQQQLGVAERQKK